jgi:carbonic anhydrase/acetyltransferase-like protein (isoleucine patch superfamily)
MSLQRKVFLLSAWLAAVSVLALFGAGDKTTSFVDPTACLRGRVRLGQQVYVAPFAELDGRKNKIVVGNESDVQDSVVVDATNGAITIGDEAIVAHGATLKGSAKTPTEIGTMGNCPGNGPLPEVCPSFVGFNAEVDGATIQKDAMVGHLARVANGVTIPSGRKVKPGMNVTKDDEVMIKTLPVTDDDRKFMHGVLEVNRAFAEQYAVEAADNVRGINNNPSTPPFNPVRHLPNLCGVDTRDPRFRNRIIGNVKMEDCLGRLDNAMGSEISVRADEGEPFVVGRIAEMSDHATFHALEHKELNLGRDGKYGTHSIVHGGEVPNDGVITRTGINVSIGAYAVVFGSILGDGVTIGEKSMVQGSKLPANTKIPPREIWVNDKFEGKVEW